MNRGAERLKALNLKQHEVARAIGTEQSVVSRWETGERRPSPRHRAKLEEEYAIGWRLWDEPPLPPADPGAAPPDDEGDTQPTRTSDRVTPVDTPAAEDADPAPQSADGAGEAGQAMGVGR